MRYSTHGGDWREVKDFPVFVNRRRPEVEEEWQKDGHAAARAYLV
jgi:hypothetical protein